MLRTAFGSWILRGVVLVAVIAMLFWHRLPSWLAIVVAIAGAVAINAAISLALSGRRSTRDLELLERAARGEQPSDGHRVAVAGRIRVDGNPLRSPFSDAECALYSYDITHEEHIPGAERNRIGDRATRTVTDFSGLALAPASIGGVKLLSFPTMENFPAGIRRGKHEITNAASFLSMTRFEKLSSSIAILDEALGHSSGAFRRDCEGAGKRNVYELTLAEAYVPANEPLVAFGTYDIQRGGIHAAGEPVRLIAGDVAAVRSHLEATSAKRPRSALALATPSILLLAALYLAPARLLTAIGLGPLLDGQRTRVADALREDDVPELRRLVAGIDVNAPIDGDVYPLMLARSAEAGRILLDAGADPNAHRAQGQSVLMEAVQFGTPDLVKLLIERGADINEVNPTWNSTPLGFAREAQNEAVVKVLLEAGAK